MTVSVVAACQYDIGKLWVQAAVLGAQVDGTFDGHRVRLHWPDKDLHLPYQEHQRMRVGTHPAVLGWNENHVSGEKTQAALGQLMLLIWLSAEEDELEDGQGHVGARMLRHATAHASKFGLNWISPYLDYCRTQADQYRMGQTGDWPVLRHVMLLDGESHEPLGIGESYLDPVAIALPTPAVSRAQHDSFVSATWASRIPTLPDRLLADARHLLSSQPTQAVLLAAIACEVRIRDELDGRAEGSQQQMLRLLLHNPRDWSMAASALFDRPAKVVLGSSLRESDKSLWKRLCELFEVRNDVAHRGGQRSTQEDQQGAVNTAVDIFQWLDTVEQDTGVS